MRRALIVALLILLWLALTSCARPPLSAERQELETVRAKALRAARWDIFALRRIARDGPDITPEDAYLCKFACGLVASEVRRDDIIEQEKGD